MNLYDKFLQKKDDLSRLFYIIDCYQVLLIVQGHHY